MSDNERKNTSMTELLLNVQHKKTVELLPVIIMMAVFGIIGILGNIITIRFYSTHRRKSPTILLIISLAIVDLLVCVMFVPNIVEMSVNVMYTSNIACKTMHFLGHWFIESSGLILGFIAFDRYRKICGSTEKTITKKFALKTVVSILTFAFLMSIRDFVNFDIVTVLIDVAENSTSATGQYCTSANDPKLKLSVVLFYVVDTVIVVIVFGAIIFTYSNIFWKVCKLKEIRTDERFLRYIPNETLGVTGNTKENSNVITASADSSNPLEQVDEVSHNVEELVNHSTTERQKKTLSMQTHIRRSDWNVTILMFAVSLGYLLCFTPFFIVKISFPSVQRASDLELGLLAQFGIRSVYINSALNPLIYCVFNPSFRRHVRRLFSCKQEHEESIYSISNVTLDKSSV